MILHLVLKNKCKINFETNYDFSLVFIKTCVKCIALVIKKISGPLEFGPSIVAHTPLANGRPWATCFKLIFQFFESGTIFEFGSSHDIGRISKYLRNYNNKNWDSKCVIQITYSMTWINWNKECRVYWKLSWFGL